jgi:hypothetical protein
MEGRYKIEKKFRAGSFWLRINCNGELVCTRQYSKILGFHEIIKLSSLSERILKIMFHGLREIINSNN